MILRAFEGQPPRITFTKDFCEAVQGDLRAGRELLLDYDAERLPHERSTIQGKPAWSITAYVKFRETDEPKAYPLWSNTGAIVSKTANVVGGGTMMKARVPVPPDTSEAIFWFVNAGESGAVYYDSDYGRNYRFRFTAQDLRVVSAEVVSDLETPYSGFGVAVRTAPAVTGVSARFQVLNTPTKPMEGTAPLTMTGQDVWSIAGVVVPYRAVISYTIVYRVSGATYIDDNHGKGYLATPDSQF